LFSDWLERTGWHGLAGMDWLAWTGWHGLAGMDWLAWTVIGYHGLILTTWVLTYLLTDGLTNGHWYLLSCYCD